MIVIKTKTKIEEQMTANELAKHKNLEVTIVNESSDAHMSKPGVGALGWSLTLDDNPLVKKIAKAIGVKDGWKLTPFGDIFAAYNAGDRLTIFEKKFDFETDEQ